jgi:hypothetical protein
MSILNVLTRCAQKIIMFQPLEYVIDVQMENGMESRKSVPLKHVQPALAISAYQRTVNINYEDVIPVLPVPITISPTLTEQIVL